MFGSPPEVIDKPIKKLLVAKLEQLTEKELDAVLEKVKSRKTAGHNKIPHEVWKTRKPDDILLRLCNAICIENTRKIGLLVNTNETDSINIPD